MVCMGMCYLHACVSLGSVVCQWFPSTTDVCDDSMLAVCYHSDSGCGFESSMEQYCVATSRSYAGPQLNNAINDADGAFELQFVCEIEVRSACEDMLCPICFSVLVERKLL